MLGWKDRVVIMSLLTKSCSYGLRAALYVAARQDKGYVSIRDISNDLAISFHFLTKILQKLTQASVMKSYRGPTGGIALAKSPRDVTILEIVEAIEGEHFLKTCVLGLSNCSDTHPCPLHAHWAKDRKRIRTLFQRTTLDKLSAITTRDDLRLTG